MPPTKMAADGKKTEKIRIITNAHEYILYTHTNANCLFAGVEVI